MGLFAKEGENIATETHITPVIVRTSNVAKELLQVAANYKVPVQSLDFHLLGIETFTKAAVEGAAEDWVEIHEEEIANLKAMELEELYTKYFLLKEQRLETFGELLNKMKKEATARDLSDLPTEKLLELLLKYENRINLEVAEPEYLSSGKMQSEKRSRELLESFS